MHIYQGMSMYIYQDTCVCVRERERVCVCVCLCMHTHTLTPSHERTHLGGLCQAAARADGQPLPGQRRDHDQGAALPQPAQQVPQKSPTKREKGRNTVCD